MGMGLEDYEPRRRELEEARLEADLLAKAEKKFKQAQLRELLVDPKWEAYAQEIDKRLTIASAAVDNLGQRMLEGDLDTFKKLMPDYRYNLGIKTAFEEALLIIKRTQQA